MFQVEIKEESAQCVILWFSENIGFFDRLVMHINREMRIIAALIFLISTTSCYAIGWRELSKADVESFNIKMGVELDTRKACHKVEAILPNVLVFGELGERKLWRVTYRKVIEKSKGWQLISHGTEINLPVTNTGEFRKVGSICLSEKDLNTGYLSALYGGPPSAPPMVVLIGLGSFDEG